MRNIKYSSLLQEDASSAKSFCLQVIKETYGYDYRPDWHADLDDLDNYSGVYSSEKDGIFYIAKSGKDIVGTIGIRTLDEKPQLLKKFEDRKYKDGKRIASIWRTYVRKDLRNQGIGSKLFALAENFIHRSGIKVIYLHTTVLNPSAIKFWENKGFGIILRDQDEEQTIHMEKILVN